MNPTIWLGLFILALVVEGIRMDLMAASFAPGALIAAIMGFAGLPVWTQPIPFVVLSALLFVFVRPELARHLNRRKKQERLEKLIGRTGTVTCEIFNAHNVGVVEIDGREYKAKTNRPNAVIDEGSKVRVVAMRGDVAVVDKIFNRATTGKIPGLDGEEFH